jgi:hypothetical protein
MSGLSSRSMRQVRCDDTARGIRSAQGASRARPFSGFFDRRIGPRRSRRLCRMGKVGVLIMTAAVALVSAPASALAASGNTAATQKYIQANFSLVQSGVSKLGAAAVALRTTKRQIEGECANAALHSPQNPESTELSNEIIGAIVIAAIRTGIPAGNAFIRAAAGLRWSNHTLTSTIQTYVAKVKVMVTLAPPNVCADLRSWVASGYQTLTASTVRFDQQFMPNWVALGELPTHLLAPYVPSSQRAILHRTGQLESTLVEFEANQGVNTWSEIMDALGVSP